MAVRTIIPRVSSSAWEHWHAGMLVLFSFCAMPPACCFEQTIARLLWTQDTLSSLSCWKTMTFMKLDVCQDVTAVVMWHQITMMRETHMSIARASFLLHHPEILIEDSCVFGRFTALENAACTANLGKHCFQNKAAHEIKFCIINLVVLQSFRTKLQQWTCTLRSELMFVPCLLKVISSF